MRSTLLSAVLALSVAAWFGQTRAATEDAATATPVAAPSGSAVVTEADSYNCCWVFYAGRWWCLPC